MDGRVFRSRYRNDGLQMSVRSGVMGSDGFESKKLGGPPSGGTGQNRLGQSGLGQSTLGPSEFSAGAERDPAMDALSGLGDAAANLVEIAGVIKWFDASKGYGFIVPDNGWPDVLLHVTVLRRDGYQTAYEGARLVVECVQRQKGYQAFRIVSMDESTAIHPAQMLPPRTHVSVTPTSGLERAQVKWFNRLRGFGFLTCGEGTPDIFVHMETLRRFGMTELRPGQYVLVRFGPGSKGMMAAEIHPETGSPALSSH
jgi:CspA family cold shock protein